MPAKYNHRKEGFVLRLTNRGFTSIELVVVIVVLGVLVASVAITNPFKLEDYSGIACDQLIADLRFIQLKALGSKTSQTITFFVNPSDYGVYNLAGVQKHLPGDIIVVSACANSITYNTRGEPSTSGDITLSYGKKVTILADTGRAE